MQRITKEQIQEYVSEVGEFEKEHRKYSSFYATATLAFTQDDINLLAHEDGIDASDLLGITVTLNGTWDDSWGTEWGDISFNKYEEYQELIPEVVIPAHYVTKHLEVPFTASFE